MAPTILGGFLKRSPLFVGIIFCLWTTCASAQVLVIRPTCGQASKTKVCINGSGWAEPNPPCRYRFFLDGVVVAPDQQDGLFGPPNSSFVVPNGTSAGNHTVKVELRENDNDALLQARQSGDSGNPAVPFFKVVAMILDPFAPPPDTTTFPGAMAITFDPKDVCDAGPCSAIRLIQTIKMEGRLKVDPTKTRALTFAEQKFPHAADYQADVTVDNVTVDQLWGNLVPYYPYPTPGKSLIGQSDGTTAPATLGDMPGRGANAYPADVDKIILTFESAVICAQGDLKGTYLGRVLWRWEQVKGGVPVVTFLGDDRMAPSPEFNNAVNVWNADAKHPFTPPMPAFPPCT